jgi:hypothetical protein
LPRAARTIRVTRPRWPPVTLAQGPGSYVPQPNYVPIPERQPVSESRSIDRSRIGSVESIEPIRERPQGMGTGAVIGGVLGAVAGNNVERNHREGVSGYRVSIRLDASSFHRV